MSCENFENPLPTGQQPSARSSRLLEGMLTSKTNARFSSNKDSQEHPAGPHAANVVPAAQQPTEPPPNTAKTADISAY
jgi:hypothetical protein